MTAKRRCEGFVSVEAFAIFSQGRDLESCGDIFLGKTSWMSLRTCLIVSRRLGWLCLFPLLLWSLSFVMVSLVAWIGNLWNRSPFSFSHSCTVTQEKMWFEEP